MNQIPSQMKQACGPHFMRPSGKLLKKLISEAHLYPPLLHFSGAPDGPWLTLASVLSTAFLRSPSALPVRPRALGKAVVLQTSTSVAQEQV
jgi:hypothetical protein